MSERFHVVMPWLPEREGMGGAEKQGIGLATALRERGHSADILTTCGLSAFEPWDRNVYRPGTSEYAGLVVRRFALDSRNRSVYDSIFPKLEAQRTLQYIDDLVLSTQMVSSRSLYHFISDFPSDYFVFLPYYYGLTYWAQKAAAHSILIPCLHDEPKAYLQTTGEMLASADWLFYNSEEEQKLSHRIWPNIRHGNLVPEGVDLVPKGNPQRFREQYHIEGPYLIYVGRKVGGKNVPLLVKWFLEGNFDDLTLVLVGSGDLKDCVSEDFAGRDNVVDLGILPEADKADAISGAVALCQLSTMESFSIVLMEAWQQSVPVIVHRDGAVTSAHCKISGGGSVCRDEADFKEKIRELVENGERRASMGRRGRDYFYENFTWDKSIRRFEEALGL